MATDWGTIEPPNPNAVDHFSQIEFTDRYGGNLPSWLTACLKCEAMGCHPDMNAPAYLASGDLDDVPFVTCSHCGGTAKVPWWRTVARLPRWLWKGLRFLWHTNTTREMHPEEWSRWHILRVTFGIAFLADLGLWRP